MSYTVLARKWRPRKFQELVGQDHVVKALVNALSAERLHHAYLFAGTRGVGKTTLARIFAKALNCTSGVVSEPCGQCDTCLAIDEGRFVDLLEVDAASRTKVEDTRELLDNVQYMPTDGRYKVYLIDEVHMLSNHSFNALLKTLEEPPPQVMFLLLTANEGAVLPTIRSRCQTMSLTPLPKNLMIERLVTEHQATPEQAEQLFRLSRGCMGWAVGALGDTQVLEQRQADLERMLETLEAGLETRFTYANEVAALFAREREAAKDLLALWLRWWRDLLLIKEGGREFLHNADHEESLNNQASDLSTAEILTFLNHLIQTMSNLDSNVSPRLAMEVLMLNLPIRANKV